MNRYLHIRIACLLLLAALLPLAAVADDQDEGEPALPLTESGVQIVAMVNGQPITLIEFQRALDRYHFDDIASYDAAAELELEKLIQQAIINQAAEALELIVTAEEVEAEYEAMREIVPDDDQWREWLALNRFLNETEFRLATHDALLTARLQEVVIQLDDAPIQQVKARHILVLTAEDAQMAYNRLESGVIDFATAAREMSVDVTTRDSGGDLGVDGGWIVPDDLIVPEIAELAISQPIGQHSAPIETILGWHIVQTLDISTRPATLEERATQSARIFDAWLYEQMQAAEIERYVYMQDDD